MKEEAMRRLQVAYHDGTCGCDDDISTYPAVPQKILEAVEELMAEADADARVSEMQGFPGSVRGHLLQAWARRARADQVFLLLLMPRLIREAKRGAYAEGFEDATSGRLAKYRRSYRNPYEGEI